MNDDNRYEPYQYGNVNEPVQQEPECHDEEIQEQEVEEINDPVESAYAPRYDYSYVPPQEPPKQTKEKPKGNSIWKVVAVIVLAIVFGIIASFVFQGTNRIFNHFFGEVNEDLGGGIVNNTQIGTNTGTTVISDVADVAESVMPSVVSITSMSIQEVQNFFFGGVTQYETQGSGSGIIIGQNNSELLIATNNHVVEGSKTITVTLIDGSSLEAQIKGTDSDMDLAIIAIPLNKISGETKNKIKVATLGDSDAIRVGEPAIAIGNALGYGQSVTLGIISALDRTIDEFEGTLIQTDAAINPGNSGGALLNSNGEVIGINTAKVSADAVEGVGYAIPISDATDILNELMNKETRTKVPESERGSIGIKGRTVDAQTSQYFNMPEGVYVSELVKGGGAEKAKLPTGCIITEIDGYDVDSMEELQEELQYYKAGQTVEFTIQVASGGKYEKQNINIKLGKAN